ncbi:glycoside hydrolase family 76 protein [Amycolatopsis pithecellobii]|uniref:Fructose-bisphosphate aldolase n=1 Tax=Amycolatopsis pithecellobii TaxID=664692 RepID=A0A6N7Z5P6_9PSEU|nr:glycoside hydrolase family 76 protein [Amycolatopsis pithecellobii]MTD57663.1 fructose-bisphosphate aldolase [Amycolatopsis pithecellobii]
MYGEWAAAAERAIMTRHVRRVWALPGTALGRSGWPPTAEQRVFLHWNYWWQAHLLDCLIDAQQRDPTPAREALIDRFLSTIRLRNFGKWTNDYFDDMAWLGLAMQRTGRDVGAILAELRRAWTPEGGGGIWWRRGDRFKNAPSNGPAAILHARAGETERARELLSWLDSTLVDPETGLVWDGLRVDDGELVTAIYTYCQGVFLGACLELSEVDAAARTVRAVAAHCAPGGVLRGQGGGDGGLFAGILARYLALAAHRLPAPEAAVARTLVLDSARAAWDGAAGAPGGPLFSSEWSRPAPDADARDLSVQVGAWLLLEAAATL